MACSLPLFGSVDVREILHHANTFCVSFAGPESGRRGLGGPKLTLKIKPFKKLPQLPPNYEDQTWDKLSSAVDAILSKSPLSTQVSREELYRNVEDMCVHKMGGKLYDKLKDKIGDRVKRVMGEVGE